MKFQAQTREVLKNFATINSGIVFVAGTNYIGTRSTANNIMAYYTDAAMTFPVTAPIYNLNSLLQIMSMSSDMEIEFDATYLTARQEGGEFKFHYAYDGLVKEVSRPEDVRRGLPLDTPIFEFSLTSGDITSLVKSGSVTGATTLSFMSDGTNAYIEASTPDNENANSFRKLIGPCPVAPFRKNLAIKDFVILPDDYTVRLYNSPIDFAYFESTTRKLEYFITFAKSS